MSFNPLDHPLLLSTPQRQAPVDAADAAAAPLVMLLVDLLRPAVLVEVGTKGGYVYCAACQAVQELGVGATCRAVGTWEAHSQALADLKAYHDPRYSAFSKLIRLPAGAASAEFAERSIDLLRLAGDGSADAVRDDVAAWLPKMSDQGIIILNGAGDAGVRWEELTTRYPQHLALSAGWGIVAVGSHIPERAQPLFDLTEGDSAAFRRLMELLGATDHAEVERLRAELRELQRSMTQTERDHAAALNMETARADALETSLTSVQAYIRHLESFPSVRLIKLARASGAVLRHKGPASLMRHAGQWLMGRRGYHLKDIVSKDNELLHPSAAVYQAWYAANRPLHSEYEAQPAASQQFALRPLMSFVTPVYNPDPEILEQTIQSVLAQTYDRWELCLVDGGSSKPGVRDVAQRYAAQDERIRVQLLDENRGIAGNSNAAVALAQGEYVTLLDHDDVVEQDLLYHVVEALNQQPETDVVYYDEDLLSADGSHVVPLHFRPDWSPELLVSTPYITHCTIRRQLILDLGGFDPAVDGTQDWDLFLRISERTNQVVRVPRVLYHWRMAPGSAAASNDAKPYVFERQLTTIRNHMQRVTGHEANVKWIVPGIPRVTWTPAPTSVSIIIPTKDKADVLRRCLTSILKKTAYKSYEFVLVDTGSVEPATFKYYEALKKQAKAAGVPVTIAQYEGEFNYSRACNVGAQHATGSSLLFMNNDMEILDADWLEELVRWSNLPEIGVVGAKLLYPDRSIQHAGVLIGSSGLAGHVYYRAEEHASSLFGSVDWYRDYLAVTGALQMMRREVYDAVGGYDEAFDISYSDVTFCYNVTRMGMRVLYDPFVRVLHYESQTRNPKPSLHDMRLAAAELASTIVAGDPSYSPHLSQQYATPRLKRVDEPSAAQMLERLVGVPIDTLKAQSAMAQAAPQSTDQPATTAPAESRARA